MKIWKEFDRERRDIEQADEKKNGEFGDRGETIVRSVILIVSYVTKRGLLEFVLCLFYLSKRGRAVYNNCMRLMNEKKIDTKLARALKILVSRGRISP